MDDYVKNTVLEKVKHAHLKATTKNDVDYLRTSCSNGQDRALLARLDILEKRVLDLRKEADEFRDMLMAILSGRMPINGGNGTASVGRCQRGRLY